MIKWKCDIIAKLKENGYSTYRIRKEKIFGESVLQNFRNGCVVYGETLDKLCSLLHCQPGDILEYTEEA